MKRAITWVLAALLLSGCGSEGPTSTTRVGAGPGIDVPSPVPLVARLVVTPILGTAASNGARPVTFRMTLVVSNVTSRDYAGEAPDAALARFALTGPAGEPIWSFPTSAAQVLTPVRIGPGQQVTYNAVTTLADIRPYIGKVLTAKGQFVAADLTTSTAIPVN